MLRGEAGDWEPSFERGGQLFSWDGAMGQLHGFNATRHNRRAYSLTDLAVLLVIIVTLIVFCVPATHLSSEQKRRAMCANNLRMLGLAATMYANADVRGGSFPRTRFDVDAVSPTPTEYTGVSAMSSFSPGGPRPNDVTAAMYLILKTQDIVSKVFVCPGSDAEPQKGVDTSATSNFVSRQFVGYSYANPYPGKVARESGFKFNNSLGSDFPLASDMNSGAAGLLTTGAGASRAQFQQVNSPNHRGDGQNVVYFDCHVEFQATPYCGAGQMGSAGRDNIFTAGLASSSSGGSIVKGAPAHREDTVMLPVIADGAQPPARGNSMDWDEPILLAGIGGGILLLVVVAVVVLLLVLRKKKPTPVMPQGYPPGAYPPGAYPPAGQYPPQYPPGQFPPRQ